MKIPALLAVAVPVVAVALFWLKARVVPSRHVRVEDIPRVLAQVAASTSSPTFAVFMFGTPDQPTPDQALNVQFSIEDGRTGLDWVLLGPRNVRDEARFVAFAQDAGFSPLRKEMNGVRYLRVEDGDLASLCRDVITRLYQVPDTELIDMITEGFEWRP